MSAVTEHLETPRIDVARDEYARDVERQIASLYQAAKSRMKEIAVRFHPELQPLGYGILRLVIDEQPVRAGQIASELGTDKSAVSRQIAMLKEMGLVETAEDPDDKRATLLVPTPSAIATRESIRSESTSGYGVLFAAWSTEDIREFARLLCQFNAAID